MKAVLKDYSKVLTKLIEDRYPEELKMGIKVEMEHTDNPKTAKQIAIGHLAENKKYYSILKESGLADELEKAINYILFFQELLKARKDFTDKLGRSWHWNEARKKYDYVRKGTSKKVETEKAETHSSTTSNSTHIALSKKAEKWLDDWTFKYQKEEYSLPLDVEKELSQFKPKEPVVLYRGVKHEDLDWNETRKLRSFTHAKGFAESVANIGENKDESQPEGKVIVKKVDPKDIVVDFTLLPEPYKSKYLDEVIVKSRVKTETEDKEDNKDSFEKAVSDSNIQPDLFYENLVDNEQKAKEFCLRKFKTTIVGKISPKNDYLWANVIYQLDLLNSKGFVNTRHLKVTQAKRGAGKKVGTREASTTGGSSTIFAMYSSSNKTIYLGKDLANSFVHEYTHHLDHTHAIRSVSYNNGKPIYHGKADRDKLISAINTLPSNPRARFDKESQKYADPTYLSRSEEMIARLGESIIRCDLEKEGQKGSFSSNLYSSLKMAREHSPAKYFTLPEVTALEPLFFKAMTTISGRKEFRSKQSDTMASSDYAEKQTPLQGQMQLLQNIDNQVILWSNLSDSIKPLFKELIDSKLATLYGRESKLELTAKGKTKLKAFIQLGGELKKSYKLQGHTTFQGLKIAIENKKGTYRRGTDPDGNDWEICMHYDYGYICFTEGPDGDAVDCYIGPNKDSLKVFVVHQLNPFSGGMYDEDKVMLGFDTVKQAKQAYWKQYDHAEKFFGSIDTWCIHDFISHIHTKKKFITQI